MSIIVLFLLFFILPISILIIISLLFSFNNKIYNIKSVEILKKDRDSFFRLIKNFNVNDKFYPQIRSEIEIKKWPWSEANKEVWYRVSHFWIKFPTGEKLIDSKSYKFKMLEDNVETNINSKIMNLFSSIEVKYK